MSYSTGLWTGAEMRVSSLFAVGATHTLGAERSASQEQGVKGVVSGRVAKGLVMLPLLLGARRTSARTEECSLDSQSLAFCLARLISSSWQFPSFCARVLSSRPMSFSVGNVLFSRKGNRI
jgi:hypothetical protein